MRSQIINASIVLEKLKYVPEEVNKLRFFADKLTSNDETNREAIAAKVFYRCLYGSEFIIRSDDGISSALKYGSKLLASAITRSLVKYGFHTHLGINHHGQENPFNLSYDLIEPFRPIIHYFVKLMGENIGDTLLYNQRLELIGLLSYRIIINEELRTVMSAIDVMVKSLFTAFKNQDSGCLHVPRIPLADNKYYQRSD